MIDSAKISACQSRSANGLEVEAGGRAHVLAGGMDETTAFGLLTDVSRVLQFKTA